MNQELAESQKLKLIQKAQRTFWQVVTDLFAAKKSKRYPHDFLVQVRIEHPQIIGGPVTKFSMTINATDQHHARKRLREELCIVVGSTKMVNLEKKK